jgi:hypothetical protein
VSHFASRGFILFTPPSAFLKITFCQIFLIIHTPWQMPIEHYKTLALFYNIFIDYLAGLVDTPKKLL